MRLISVLIIFISLYAYADFDYQIKNSVGLWKPTNQSHTTYLQISMSSDTNKLILEDCADYEIARKCQGYENYITVGEYQEYRDAVVAYYQDWPLPWSQIQVDPKNPNTLTRDTNDGKFSYVRVQ